MSENPINPDSFNQFSTDWFDPEQVLKAVTEQKQTQMDPSNNLDRIASALREHPDIQDVHLAILKADDLGLEDSPKERLVAYLAVDAQRCPVIKSKVRHEFPNNMALVYMNKYEVDGMYKETFLDQVYFKYGITLDNNPCVFDVGSNLGIFTLLTQQLYPNARVFSFEPSPPIFELLQINTSLYAPNATLFNQGVSNEKKKASFTFYPRATGSSGYYANAEQVATDAKSRMLHFHPSDGSDEEQAQRKQQVDRIVGEAFEGLEYETQLTSISDAMRETGVDRIDLLKIDAEKSEWDILHGIQDDDYPKIKQIVMEVHEEADADKFNINRIVHLLQDKGYYVIFDQPADFLDTKEYMLYASRTPLSKDSVSQTPALPILKTSLINSAELEGFLKGKIPLNWLPSAFVFLTELPRTRAGGIDLEKLPTLDVDNTKGHIETYVMPRTPTEEKLAAIWADLLGYKRVSIHDDFFELGGHSLSVTQLLSRVCETFSVNIPMRVFFTNPSGRITIAELARIVEEHQLDQLNEEDIASAMAMLDGLSEEEVARLLAETDDEQD